MHFKFTFQHQGRGVVTVTGLTVELSTDSNGKEQWSTAHHHDESNWMNAAQARAQVPSRLATKETATRTHTSTDMAHTNTHTVVTNEDHVKQACLPLPPPPLPLPPLLTPPHSVRHLRLCCSDYLRPISAAPILTYSH